jgi:hypothetical protein
MAGFWTDSGTIAPNELLESDRGEPHSKTLSRRIARNSFREVLKCGCPLPLFLQLSARTFCFSGFLQALGC